jgi:ribosomal protein S6--L-glutamate ligase
VLSREDNYSTRRLVQEGEARGHVVEVIDTTRCYMAINAKAPEVHYDGHRLPRYDAVVPRIGASITPYGTAVVRQFETIGTYCVNPSAGIAASRDKLQAHQVLASRRIGMPTTAFAASPKDTKNLMELVGSAPMIVKLLESTQGKGVVLAETKKAAESVIDAFRGLRANFLVQQFVKEAAGVDIRCLVIGGKVVAAMKRTGADGDFRSNLHRGGSAKSIKITPEERSTAVRAAKVMGLNVAGVDLLRANHGPVIMEVNSSPGLEGIENATGVKVADKIIEFIENNYQPGKTKTRGKG